MQGEQGVVAHVKLPTAAEQAEYDTLELDFTLSCPGQSASSAVTPLANTDTLQNGTCNGPLHSRGN